MAALASSGGAVGGVGESPAVAAVASEARQQAFGKLNTSKLQTELATAVRTEEERVNIDEMKKRAIHTARSYEEFRQMVLCANLKPMKSKELEDLGKSRPWERHFSANSVARSGDTENFTTARFRKRRDRRQGSGSSSSGSASASASAASRARGARRGRGRGAAAANVLATGLPGAAPRSSLEFQRDWQRRCKTPQLRSAYLLFVGSQTLSKIFAAAFPSGLLGEIIAALHHGAQDEENAAASIAMVMKHVAAAAGGAGGEDEEKSDREPATVNRAPLFREFLFETMKALAASSAFPMETMFLSKAERGQVRVLLDYLAADPAAGLDLVPVAEAYNFG